MGQERATQGYLLSFIAWCYGPVGGDDVLDVKQRENNSLLEPVNTFIRFSVDVHHVQIGTVAKV